MLSKGTREVLSGEERDTPHALRSINVAVGRIAVSTFHDSLDFSVAEIEEIRLPYQAVSIAVLHAYPVESAR